MCSEKWGGKCAVVGRGSAVKSGEESAVVGRGGCSERWVGECAVEYLQVCDIHAEKQAQMHVHTFSHSTPIHTHALT